MAIHNPQTAKTFLPPVAGRVQIEIYFADNQIKLCVGLLRNQSPFIRFSVSAIPHAKCSPKYAPAKKIALPLKTIPHSSPQKLERHIAFRTHQNSKFTAGTEIMNFVDFFLIAIILLSAGLGFQRGFISGLLDLLRWLGSLLLAFLLYNPVARLIDRVTDLPDIWLQPFAFLIVLVGASFFIQYLGAQFLKRLPRETHEGKINKFLGVLPGFVSGAVMAAILAALLFAVPFSDGLQESLSESPTANRLAIFTDDLESALAPIFEKAVEETLTRRITINPGSAETYQLPYKVTNYRPRPDLETEMLALINRERAAEGLAPLEPDPEMREVAVKHSADMFERGYFSHNTPENKTPFDRMRAGDVRFRTAGENLALAPSLQIAHTGLMNSPGHRANILRPQFGRVGIAILDGGRRGLMITQKFRN